METLQLSDAEPRPASKNYASQPICEVEVILKVAERCNLACDYCYYFFKGDESYASKPPRVKFDTIRDTARFLAEGAAELNLPAMKIVFHGGEPLLMRKDDFAAACDLFIQSIAPPTKLTLSVQTNGVLLDDRWLEIFERYGVSVGVSLDGTKEVNDVHRIDLKGRGTYDRVAKGVGLLRSAHDAGGGIEPALLTVLDAETDVQATYRHFTEVLGVRNLAFLLPDCSHDDGIPGEATAADYGRVLCDLFDMWAADQTIQLREVSRVLAFFSNSPRAMWHGRRNPVVVIRSDGEVNFDDSYVPAQSWRDSAPKGSVHTDSLSSWLNNSGFQEIDSHYASTPTGCSECCWRMLCRGGDLENRYSSDNGFDNPSVFCEGLQDYYLHVTKYLSANGYPVKDIMAKLSPSAAGSA